MSCLGFEPWTPRAPITGPVDVNVKYTSSTGVSMWLEFNCAVVQSFFFKLYKVISTQNGYYAA